MSNVEVESAAIRIAPRCVRPSGYSIRQLRHRLLVGWRPRNYIRHNAEVELSIRWRPGPLQVLRLGRSGREDRTKQRLDLSNDSRLLYAAHHCTMCATVPVESAQSSNRAMLSSLLVWRGQGVDGAGQVVTTRRLARCCCGLVRWSLAVDAVAGQLEAFSSERASWWRVYCRTSRRCRSAVASRILDPGMAAPPSCLPPSGAPT